MIFRNFEKSDLEVLIDLNPPDWQDIRPAHHLYLEHAWMFPQVVEKFNQVAGIGTLIVHQNQAWLAHIIVHPQFRNLGLGKAMTKHLMELAFSKKIYSLHLIATPQGEPVYTRCGFDNGSQYLFFKEVNYGPATDEVILRNAQADDHAWILQLDQKITGEIRSDYLKLFLPNAIVAEQNNTPQGFYLPNAGEGLVMATDFEAGLALLRNRAKNQPALSFSAENKKLENYLKGLGNVVSRSALRMGFGPMPHSNYQWQFQRIGGNLG